METIKIPFYSFSGFIAVCTFNCSYFAWNYGFGFVKFDKNWSILNQSYFFLEPQAMLSVDFSNTKILYVANLNGIYSLDINLNVLKTFQFYQNFQYYNQYYQNYPSYQYGTNAIYYNNITDHILFAVAGGIIFFSPDLEFLSFYYIANSAITGITGYKGLIFVSAAGSIWVLKNETISYTFQSLCSQIKKLESDQFGYIAVVCKTNTIYLYFTNGTYAGVGWTSPFSSTVDVGFDANGNLVIAANGGIYLYH